MYLRIFLKVCENCGVLWFRGQDCPDMYCLACTRKLRSLPPVRPRGRPGRRAQQRSCASATGGRP